MFQFSIAQSMVRTLYGNFLKYILTFVNNLPPPQINSTSPLGIDVWNVYYNANLLNN